MTTIRVQLGKDGWTFTDAAGEVRACFRNIGKLVEHMAFLLDHMDHLERMVKTLKACRRLDPNEDLPCDCPAAQKRELLEWLVWLAWKHEEIGESRAAEILGIDIVSAREVLQKHDTGA